MDAIPQPGRRAEHPVTLESDQAIRRHLETVVTAADRVGHTAFAVLCDPRARPILHCAVDDCAPEPSASECARAVDVFAAALAGQEPSGGLLLAVTRPGEGRACESDRRWYHGMNRACARHDVRPLGTYVLTPAAVFQVTLDDLL